LRKHSLKICPQASTFKDQGVSDDNSCIYENKFVGLTNAGKKKGLRANLEKNMAWIERGGRSGPDLALRGGNEEYSEKCRWNGKKGTKGRGNKSTG